jgi:hypothetical protein
LKNTLHYLYRKEFKEDIALKLESPCKSQIGETISSPDSNVDYKVIFNKYVMFMPLIEQGFFFEYILDHPIFANISILMKFQDPV